MDFTPYLLGFLRDDSKCGCVKRRWWCRPCSEVFWRLSVGVGGSLKFKRIVALRGSIDQAIDKGIAVETATCIDAVTPVTNTVR